MSKQYKIQADLDYLDAQINQPQIQMFIDENRINEFMELSPEDKIDFLSINGTIIISQFDVEDHGNLYDLTITEVNKDDKT